MVTHVRLGLDEVAACLLAAGTCSAAPDRDAATYWLAQPPGSDDEIAGLVAVRRVASATRAPRGALAPLGRVATGLRSAAGRLPDGVVAFQGCVLTTGDLLATWAVELAVHQLDLAREVDVAPPATGALDLARRTADALTDAGLPAPAFAGRLRALVDAGGS